MVDKRPIGYIPGKGNVIEIEQKFIYDIIIKHLKNKIDFDLKIIATRQESSKNKEI